MNLSFVTLLACTVPLMYLLSALVSIRGKHIARLRGLQFFFASVAFALAIISVGSNLIASDDGGLPVISNQPLSLIMLTLISFIGLVVSRFSQRYLEYEENEAKYYQALHSALAAASFVVISNHMLLLLIAWITISLSLNRLLTFYPGRPRAALAAHKKFLFARCAELSLLAAFVLIYLEYGSWYIDESLAAMSSQALSGTGHLAAILLAMAALIKCAQMPVHGWLTQVVEAPTPVSALLHAGIINLGGFLLILFAPLFMKSIFAQWFVLLVAGLTTILAALVMLTRVSVKVRLAWSTIAQMGLMLVECALGLYELALLHLVAHSCYKAYAFLNAGAAVESDMVRRMAAPLQITGKRWVVAFLCAFTLAVIPAYYFSLDAHSTALSPWLLFGSMLMLLLLQQREGETLLSLFRALSFAVMLVVAYSAQKYAAGWVLPHSVSAVGWVGDLWFATLILVMTAGYVLLVYAPNSAFSSRLWHALYAGLYLDEWSTRITLAIWPTRLPKANNKHQARGVLRQEPLS